jgi:hypothetical protein
MRLTESSKRERGAALLITSIVLVLVSMITLAAISHSEKEATGSARSRSSTRAFYAADAGVELALSRLRQSPPDLTAFDVDLADGANVQSRSRAEATPQSLDQVGTGETPEGYAVNVGSGAGYSNRVYLVNVTSSAGGSTIEVEAKLIRGDASALGY